MVGPVDMNATEFNLEVKPRVPAGLVRLHELASNLLYSWHRPIRELFFGLDMSLWKDCNHSPKLFLRRVDQDKLEAAADDAAYLEKYRRVLSWYDNYLGTVMAAPGRFNDALPLTAYFCAEYGFHESFPIYSGGLGILAGDHCKAASDMGIPFVAVGLLYHQGYFTQTIDSRGRQVSLGVNQPFVNQPIESVQSGPGTPLYVTVDIAEREVILRVWRANVGRISLYLLDSDLPDNSAEDRQITHQLYGGDHRTRIQQEIILGVGGVRALQALGLQPTVWHINEGHAAFQVLERTLTLTRQGADFYSALEQVAGATVFTMHTPIAAGHDSFDKETMVHYFSRYLQAANISFEEFLALGRSAVDQHRFDMTSLALRGSRFYNGVSRIHGGVAARMEQHIWPQIPAAENPVGYITNGVHIESILDKDWIELFDGRFPDWRERAQEKDFWSCLDSVDDEIWWDIHSAIKRSLFRDIHRRLCHQHRRNGLSEALIERSTAYLTGERSDILVIGFARRFATYKRATLLFSQLERLTELVNNADRPVVFIFAGKAHPGDEPGKALIQRIYEYSLQPEFIGRVLLLEGYDIAMARVLVAGCDVWLNTPEYPLEACGTSGQKAGVNGVLNLSIRDGWWDEGYNGRNGWAVAPHCQKAGEEDWDPDYCARQEAIDIFNILEHQVIPTYYRRDGARYASDWVRLSRASMQSIISRFSAQRMVTEYVDEMYKPAALQQQRLAQGSNANTLARWKKYVSERWPGVRATCLAAPDDEIFYRESVSIRVRIELHGLSSDDVVVDCLLGLGGGEEFAADHCVRFQIDPTSPMSNGDAVFVLDWAPEFCGLKSYRVRIYPSHPLLSHPFEMGFMLWL